MAHRFDDKFNKISDLMDRYYNDGKQGARPGSEYRGELRNAARIAYRIAKKAIKAQQKG
tara:strand:+ start:1606 stop:1782 length:177 start_codon:yes stop_codon:yes gene_type:complete